ncbi:MAG: M1 family aminopeptidase [Candidatus Acidiferrum sp.]
MILQSPINIRQRRTPHLLFAMAGFLLLFLAATSLRADEPFARSRDYDLQHSKIFFSFDLDHKTVLGDVTHTLVILRNNTSKLSFDSVALEIETVTVNKSAAKFETTGTRLNVSLPAPAKAGDKFDIEIKYQGKPNKGLYFILPDKDYPNRPRQVWSQGESEDTRYYIPTYDYPNDRLTTETILTVPASWLTVSNGKLVSVSDAPGGMKTWTWKESVPSSTYLFSIVAGELDEVKDSWRDIPVTYYAPKSRGDRLVPTYSRTPAMIELFSKKLGVDYPWEKYAQSMVDDFVAGGMENSSATTNTSSSLVHPSLIPEYTVNEDPLISHELAHQWFGDLVTCKDWGNIWLNEGFATFMEKVWSEANFPREQSEYERWTDARHWFAQSNLFRKPIVRHDFDDSGEFDGNAYTKGGWVLDMLRHQLGEEAFYRGLQHYLEVNRGKNVVTADLVKAIEEATHANVDLFFTQWVYGAGAPKFDLSYVYDPAKHEVALTVKQTQKREGRVGLFHIPTEVEITTASGAKSFPVPVYRETETFTYPVDTAPLLILFDKGGHVLKTADFHKERKEWLYQLKNATEFSDRADAATALGKRKNDGEAVEALADILSNARDWTIRAVAADSLGQIGGSAASKHLLEAASTAKQPWVLTHIAAALGNFKDDPAVAAKLEAIARDHHSYRARAAAMQSLGRLKAPNAAATLTAAVAADSPDDFLRNAALRALGSLEDVKSVPLLREWALPGRSIDSRRAAISSLAHLQKDNKEVTTQIASYLTEPHFTVRMAAIRALGMRGDVTAIPALEALLKSDDLSIDMVPAIKEQLARLQNPSAPAANPHAEDDEEEDAHMENVKENTDTRLEHLEHLIQEMSDHLKSIEARLPPQK